VCIQAAQAALAAGALDEACRHARQALAIAGCVDAWIDEPASVWLAAAGVLGAAGHAAEGQAAATLGAAWVREHAAAWTLAHERQAWLDGNPVHRSLIKLASHARG
jgi:hypothetical protein